MKEISAKRREADAELRRCWPVLVLFLILAGGPALIMEWFGNGRAAIAAGIALAGWLAIRPWRFYDLSAETSWGLRIIASLQLFFLLTTYVVSYSKY